MLKQPKPRSTRARGRLAALTVALAVTTTVGLGTVAGATGRGNRPAPSPKPTIVLVHGPWADASSWSAVIKRLQTAGYAVDAPPNPLRGLAQDTASVSAFLATVAGPIILVGHSYGGAVITDAASGDNNVKALVYVDAFAPDAGESLLQLVAGQPGSALAADPATVFNVVPIPGGGGDVDTYLKPELFRAAFAADLPARQAAELASRQRPLAASATQQPSTEPAWKTIPSWYLIGVDDKVLPAAEQLDMARRAGSHITQIHASHVSLISHPGAVESLVERADHATR